MLAAQARRARGFVHLRTRVAAATDVSADPHPGPTPQDLNASATPSRGRVLRETDPRPEPPRSFLGRFTVSALSCNGWGS
jgi:hypothetical protein